jgi:division protein CdvB (Snf7/Vps24/ESCRT-III family)
MQILEEAEVAAENRLKDRLPEINTERNIEKRATIEV